MRLVEALGERAGEPARHVRVGEVRPELYRPPARAVGGPHIGLARVPVLEHHRVTIGEASVSPREGRVLGDGLLEQYPGGVLAAPQQLVGELPALQVAVVGKDVRRRRTRHGALFGVGR